MNFTDIDANRSLMVAYGHDQEIIEEFGHIIMVGVNSEKVEISLYFEPEGQTDEKEWYNYIMTFTPMLTKEDTYYMSVRYSGHGQVRYDIVRYLFSAMRG